ncbi:ATP-binding protein, partial [Streptomyces sp. NPDC057909]|uniref:ATP-binding protein n=1 Tax=Streptomyces sp. NPDC057909 TaxID=3346277 RepID=UPI0036E5ECAA
TPPMRAPVPAPRSPADNSGTWSLTHGPQAPGAARRIAAAVLDDWHVEGDAAQMALLVVSELVTNAVEHARPPLALHLDSPSGDGTMHVEVEDGGPSLVEGSWTASCSDDEHGRGNGIIDILATAHGTHTHPGGASHWVDLPTAA